MVFECRGGGGEVGGGVYISQLHNIIMSTPLRGGSTYCFTAVSISVSVSISDFSVSVSVSVQSLPKAPPARFLFGCTKILSLLLYRDHFPLVTLTFRVKVKPVEVIIRRIT